MSNLPLQSAAIHNDDNDEQTNLSNNKLSTINSRITSRLIIKRQQYIETKIANNQACDEIHDLQPKYSLIKTTNNDNSYTKNSKLNSSHELMQGNYYDRTRFDLDYSSSSSSNHQSEPVSIDINVADYKKTFTPTSTSENSNNKDRSHSPPFGDTSESIQQNIAQSAGRLLELNKKPQYHQNSMKTNNKSHERATINYFPNDNDNQQRSLSPSSSSDCSTSDSSTSNKCQEDKDKTNIPYEKLLNDEDDDEFIEQPIKPLTESTTLLNKNLSQTYGTQSTTNIPYERTKYLSNNGYNSHGSSITTKSSSDNSGSIRTNSGSDNDEESDEEHYNNSTVSNNPSSLSIYSHTNDSSIKSLNKSNDIRHSYSNKQNSHHLRRSNISRSEQIVNNDEHHLQVPRFKHLPIDDPNGNNNKLNSGTDPNILPYTSKWSSQQSSTNQTNTLSSSSQQNLSNFSRQNSRQHQIRTTKKRKQSQQQDIIRTELIPGHRGDRDVDELVMFIDGNSSKQIQNSVSLPPNDTNKLKLSSKINSLNDSNSNKTSSRKKSRKSIQSIDNTETKTSTDQTTTTTHSIIDLSEHQNISPDNKDESHTIDINSTNTTNGETSLPDWLEQISGVSLQKNDSDSSSLSPSITNNSNSEIISEPFVTVTHRRRLIKERRQDNNSSSRLPSSTSSNINEKRRNLSTVQNGITRPIINNKSNNSSIIKEENTPPPIPSETVPSPLISIVNPVTEQSSPRLSSHSSSSSSSSLLKRQSKLPPVVFLNKSIDIELNDVSFGFDLDSTTLNPSSTIEQEDIDIPNILSSSSIEPPQPNEIFTENSSRKFQQRNTRGPQFYSGSDIRPHHHRNYPPQSSYIDPLLLLQYNQQRLANYSQQLAYMNFFRTHYVSPQSQYIFLPTTNENDFDNETNQISTDQIQEPLLVYTNSSGQIYYHPSTTKKSFIDSEQTSSIPPVYPTPPTIYPSHYFYPSQIQHIIPSHPAYFQPISSPSLVIDTKSEQGDDDDDANSTTFSHHIRQQTSADIMSNALQLVYSQQRRNAQTDRFNLDDLTAYLAMKWTDTIDHYMQGDSRILLIDEQ